MQRDKTGQNVSFQMINRTDGTDVTTGTPTITVTLDGGTQTVGGGSAPVHKGGGEWSYSPVQAETNAIHVAFRLSIANAISQTVNVYPTPIESDVQDLGTRLPAALVSGKMDSNLSLIDGVDVKEAALAISITMPDWVGVPPSGNEKNSGWVLIKGANGQPIDPDGADDPTRIANLNLQASNEDGADRTSNISGTVRLGQGLYGFDYLVASTHLKEQIAVSCSALVSGLNYPAATLFRVGSLTQQEVADAMRLTPAGTVQADSIDQKLSLALELVDAGYHGWGVISQINSTTEFEITGANVPTTSAAGTGTQILICDGTVVTRRTTANCTNFADGPPATVTHDAVTNFAKVNDLVYFFAPRSLVGTNRTQQKLEVDTSFAAKTDVTTVNRAEPAAGAVPAATTMANKLDYLFKLERNAKTQTTTGEQIKGDDGTTHHNRTLSYTPGVQADVGELGT